MFDKPEKQSEKSNEEKQSVIAEIFDYYELCIFSICAVIVIFSFFIRLCRVDGQSMEDTLHNNEMLLVTDVFYTPERGDVIVFHQTGGQNKDIYSFSLNEPIVKRVIATAGQTVNIDFENGIVYVDGEALSESYIKEPTYYNSGAFEYPVTVPEGYVFVMGDNRNNSTDSRDPHVGFVKKDDVLGKAVLRFYPFEKFKVLD